MTTAEFLSAHAARDDTAGFDRATGIDFFGLNGLDISRDPGKVRTGNRYRTRRARAAAAPTGGILHGDTLAIGGHDWRVICVFGHAPEHAALYCASLGVLISGDQVLPRITTQRGRVGQPAGGEPAARSTSTPSRASPTSPARVRVLPSHDRVFEGLHPRIIQLRAAPRRAAREAARRRAIAR